MICCNLSPRSPRPPRGCRRWLWQYAWFVLFLWFTASSSSVCLVVRGEDGVVHVEPDNNNVPRQQEEEPSLLALCQAQVLDFQSHREPMLLARIQQLEDQYTTTTNALQREIETLQIQHAQTLASTVESLQQELQNQIRSNMELQQQENRQRQLRHQQQAEYYSQETQKIRALRQQLVTCQQRLHHTQTDLYTVRRELFQLHEQQRNQQLYWKLLRFEIQAVTHRMKEKLSQEFQMWIQTSGLHERYQTQFQPYWQHLVHEQFPIWKQWISQTLKFLQNQTASTWERFLKYMHHRQTSLQMWYMDTVHRIVVQPLWNEILLPTYHDTKAPKMVQEIHTFIQTQYRESIQPILARGKSIYTRTKTFLRVDGRDLVRDYCFLQGYYNDDTASSHWIPTTLDWVHDHAARIVDGIETTCLLALLYEMISSSLRRRRRRQRARWLAQQQQKKLKKIKRE